MSVSFLSSKPIILIHRKREISQGNYQYAPVEILQVSTASALLKFRYRKMRIDFAEVPDPGGRYELGDLLGCGVYGKVRLATDSQASKKRVAVKAQKYDSESGQYVEEEYRVLRDINVHLNLVDFYGVFKKEGEIWFVLEVGMDFDDLFCKVFSLNPFPVVEKSS